MAANSGGRTVLIIVVVVAVLAVLAYALGLFNVDASGDLKAPDIEASVDVKGGEVPDVQVETADIDVGTKTETIEVPDIDIQPAGDDGSANK